MKLDEAAIKEFKRIYQEEFGEVLSDEEAYEKASGLLRLFEIVYRPLPVDNDRSCKNRNSVIQ